MLGLTLRGEFQGELLQGTAVELANATSTGATQLRAEDFFEITYPTRDVLAAIEAVGSGEGRAVVLLGERGSGKSHLLAALYHAMTDPGATRTWLSRWSRRLVAPRLASLPLRPAMPLVASTLTEHSYPFLWDVLFDHHPGGERARARWEASGRKTDVPPRDLIAAMLDEAPIALLLDELQAWFEGQVETQEKTAQNLDFGLSPGPCRARPRLPGAADAGRRGRRRARRRTAHRRPCPSLPHPPLGLRRAEARAARGAGRPPRPRPPRSARLRRPRRLRLPPGPGSTRPRARRSTCAGR